MLHFLKLDNRKLLIIEKKKSYLYSCFFIRKSSKSCMFLKKKVQIISNIISHKEV